MARFLALTAFGNPVRAYLASAGLFLAWFYGFLFVRSQLISRLKRPPDQAASVKFNRLLIQQVLRIGNAEYAVAALYLATDGLLLAAAADKILFAALIAVLCARGAIAVDALAVYALRRTAVFSRPDAHTTSVFKNVRVLAGAVVWVIAAMFFLDNLGVHVTAAIAGLGIGGVAVAMAGQQILGDLFGSFAILMDKPFMVGDYIILGDMMGTVEHIGIKTTRLRSLGGELLVFPNSDLTRTPLRNYQNMEKRRIVLNFGLVYQTPPEKVRAVPGMVGEVLAKIPGVELDRAHFKGFGASSLDFEAVYYVLSKEYNVYMDAQQAINLALMDRFARERLEFAYPTQTILLPGAGTA